MITKICGIQNEDTLICCENNGVDFFSTAGSEITASFLAKKKLNL